MIAPMIVVFREARQGALEFPRAKVLLESDDVFHRPVGHVRRLHRRPERPRQDAARVIVEHGRQVVPAPPDNLQVGEVKSVCHNSLGRCVG